jgi:hypothetical protein
MWKKLMVMGLCGGALAVASAADAKPHTHKYATGLGYQSGPPFYHGQLQSKKGACLKGRTVTLYGKRPGKKDRAESNGTSDKQGKWNVPLPIQDTTGDTAIYFKVSTAKHKGFVCNSGRTKSFKIGGN